MGCGPLDSVEGLGEGGGCVGEDVAFLRGEVTAPVGDFDVAL